MSRRRRSPGYTTGPLFTDDAVVRIFEFTKGLPRRINQVCTIALMAGLIDQNQFLDEAAIRKASPNLITTNDSPSARISNAL